MLFINLGNDCRQFGICPLKLQTVDAAQRQKNDRILVHPLPAELPVLRNRKLRKSRAAVLSDIKKLREHIHAKGLSKTARPCDQCDLRCVRFQKFLDQSAFVHIVIAILPNIRKT